MPENETSGSRQPEVQPTSGHMLLRMMTAGDLIDGDQLRKDIDEVVDSEI